jgi:putative DNA methylase
MTQTYKKKLIEVAIPLEAINAAAAYEKLPGIGAHPRGTHLWWARRPHGAARAILFAQLVDDPSSNPQKFPSLAEQELERGRLFKIVADLAKWENSENEEVLKAATKEIKASVGDIEPVIYDPFSGGGSIPLEAGRIGLKAHASDLNPVAVTLLKAMLEIFPQFKNKKPIHKGIKERNLYNDLDGIVEDFLYYGHRWIEQTKKNRTNVYPLVTIPEKFGGGLGKAVAWIWARTIPSPDPALNGLPVPLIKSFELSTKKGKRYWIEPIIRNNAYEFKIRSEILGDTGKAQKGTVGRQGATCIVSGAAIPLSYIREQAKKGQMGQTLVAIALERRGGKIYVAPSPNEPFIALQYLEDDIPSGQIEHWPGCTNCVVYGMDNFSLLFNERQGKSLTEFSNNIPKVIEEMELDFNEHLAKADNNFLRDEFETYKVAMTILLSFSLDRALDFNNTLTGWRAGNEKIMYLFSRHAIPMVWDYGEANIFENVVGGMPSIIKYQAKCLAKIPTNKIGKAIQADAQTLNYGEHAVVSTDPPYYDNVPYSNLSDFFYIWLRKNLRSFIPELFSTMMVPKQEELVANQFRHGSQSNAERHFLDGMKKTFKNMADKVSNDFPVTIYYAFKQSEVEAEGLASTGWATFLTAIFESGFTINRTWPVRTESSSRLRALGSNALANSVVLVCRKREIFAETITRAEFIRHLKQELPPALIELQEASVSPADLPQSAIGPGIGIFSRYGAILESDDSPMSVKTALQIINAQLDEFMNNLHGDFDPETRFAATWFEQNGYAKSDFGAANSLATARGIAVDSVKHAGIVESLAGKVRILKREELDPNWDPNADTHVTIWECCQYLVREYEEGGEAAAAMLIKKMGYEKAESVKDLAYYLYDICSNKRQDAKEATSYNALISGWNDIMRMANSIHDTDTTRQASLF